MTRFAVTRVGTVFAVADVGRSVAFYTEHLGFDVERLYDDPPYAILTCKGVRHSFIEQGHPADDRPGIILHAPSDRTRLPGYVLLEVDDVDAVYRQLVAEGVTTLTRPYSPPWGGYRFFCVDPDGYLVEIEKL